MTDGRVDKVVDASPARAVVEELSDGTTVCLKPVLIGKVVAPLIQGEVWGLPEGIVVLAVTGRPVMAVHPSVGTVLWVPMGGSDV